MLIKDNVQLALRDTVLPQPEEIFGIIDNENQSHAEEKLYEYLNHCFVGTRDSHKKIVELILRQAALGLSFSAGGPIYAFDHHHVKNLIIDYVGNGTPKSDALIEILTVNTFKHPNLCVFLIVPDSDFYLEEEEDLDEVV